MKEEDVAFVALEFDLLLPFLADFDFLLPDLHAVCQLLLLLRIAEALDSVDVLRHIVYIGDALEETLPLAVLELRYLLVELNDSARVFEELSDARLDFVSDVLLHLLELGAHSELFLFAITILLLAREPGIYADCAALLRDYVEIHGACVEFVLLLPLLEYASTFGFDGHPALIGECVERVDLVRLHELVAHVHLPVRFELIRDGGGGVMGTFAFARQAPHSLGGLLPFLLDFESQLYGGDAARGVHFAVDGDASLNQVDPDALGIGI